MACENLIHKLRFAGGPTKIAVVEFHATPEEAAAIDELCKTLDLSPEQVLRQGLRLYQSVTKGHATVTTPFLGGCGGEE
jgi:hypothetical protein